MRAAFNDTEIMEIDGQVVGVNLGADFCSEHEWGVKELLRDFNVKQDLIGVDGRKINMCPDRLLFQKITIDKMKCIILAMPSNTFFWNKADKRITKKDISHFELPIWKLHESDICASWDSGSFAILVREDKEKEISELYEAFKNLDVCIGLAPSHVFKNGGLKFCIASRLPEETVNKIRDDDLDYIALQKAVEKTKIEKRLKKAGKKWFALSPRWKDEEKKEVIFWLNPYYQNKDNFGWFTVDDLEDWIKGTGKIPINEQ